MESRFIGWLFVSWILLAACARYEPSPLTRERIENSLAAPDADEVRLEASQLRHPLLPSIAFDDSDGLSPDEAAIYAVVAHPGLRAIRGRRGLARAQLIQAGILPNPEISFQAGKPVAGDTAGTVNPYGAGLSWELSSLAGRSARIESASKEAESVDLDVAWQEWQRAEAAKLAVYRLVLAQRRHSLAAERQRRRQNEFDSVRAGVALQERTALDREVAQAELEKAKWDRLAAEAARDKARLELHRALGLPPDRDLSLQPGISLPGVDDFPTTPIAFQQLESRRLDLVALRMGYESEEARLRAAIQRQFPRIRLGFSGERDPENVGTVGVGVSIDFPLFDRNQGTIALERATRQQLYDEYVSRVFEARSDVARLLSDIASTRKRIHATEATLRTLTASADRAERALQTRSIDLPTFFAAVNPSDDAKAELLRLQGELTDQAIALEIATGTFDLSAVKPTSLPAQTAQGTQQ